jgi:uncharacterized lipoprotein YehR (DUF1307 family)
MKISKLIYSLLFVVLSFLTTACGDTKSKQETTEAHGHAHDADGNHQETPAVEQEEFTVDSTSNEMKNESIGLSHDDGSEHHDH